jgi:heptosyltransferase-2
MIKTDCAHFQLDKPCLFHKDNGIKCGSCGSYEPVTGRGAGAFKVLIVKLDAMGDVLRSTFLLPGLKEKYRNCRITWIVAPESVEILDGNPYLDRIWPNDKYIYRKLLCEKFNVVINLDLSPASLSLATIAVAGKKTGFTLDEKRKVVCSNEYAKDWLQMSAFDDVKKQNSKTYQWHMSKIAGLKRADYEIFVPLKKDSVKKANAFSGKHGLSGKRVIGINPGAGGRWKLKKWTDRGYAELIKRLQADGYKVLLFGGKQEEKLINSYVKKTEAVSAGTDNSLSDFFALLNLCDMIITGDTLAMHAALGLKKKIVAIFGPTSSNEIEIYGRGSKVVSPIDCTCCYITECDKKPNCMDMIKTEDVWKSFFSTGYGVQSSKNSQPRTPHSVPGTDL